MIYQKEHRIWNRVEMKWKEKRVTKEVGTEIQLVTLPYRTQKNSVLFCE
jgi:hypothetical protein